MLQKVILRLFLRSKGKKPRSSTCSGAHSMIQASLVAQLVKNPPSVRETWVWFLGWEDPLKKGKATHSGILA